MGSLPWQGYKSHNKFDKYQRIKQLKSELSIDRICTGAPQQLKIYIATVRDIKFEAQPKYDELRSLFRKLFDKRAYEWDYEYDWTRLNNTKKMLSSGDWGTSNGKTRINKEINFPQ